MEWGPDIWRPYGQWISETALRHTWRASHDSLRSSYFPRWASRNGSTVSEIRKKYAYYPGNLKIHAEDKHSSSTDYAPRFPRSSKVDISWIPPTHQKEVRYLLECTDKESGRKWVFDQSWAQTQRELKTTPGNTYWEIKAVFSYDEMTRMYLKCVDFVGTQMQPFEVLYRCKPREYWDEIHHCHDGLMEKYIKDNNGQPANRINGVISGLFFSARVYADGSLPTHSPFGNVRMQVPPGALLDPAINNFYFADFYCNYYTHYVTVVICRKGSETDNYCYMRLHQMNPEDNPFLTVSPPRYPHYTATYFVNSGVWVEIYYTEDIPLWTSKIGGLPNNKHCGRCNLYPIPYPDDIVVIDDTDDTHDEVGVADITVAENPPNSTFRVLMNESKSEITEDWEDVVEVICSMVDQVCEVDKEREKDCIAASDAVIDDVLLAMDKELDKCHDKAVQKAADLLKEVVKTIRNERAVLERLIRHIGVLQKLQSPTNVLAAGALPNQSSTGIRKGRKKSADVTKGS
ncbi:hypothetical protein KIN20_001321 [Parelaphostrongylus tenuis]|uniref:Phytanoyl-CoA hydroxylase-interacting protein-like C-terminal domain-containing protein n=1 Tax=Parelaphostrongylus tenuis TaxID=148309 RepID=A0AAD5QC59_PARTN|nr:hypothetical protein KIN20_001321 [Parelaphostrongylus tenuis]